MSGCWTKIRWTRHLSPGLGALGDLYQHKVNVAFSAQTGNYTRRGEKLQNGWFFYSYDELEQHVTLVAGRWPDNQLPYFTPSVGGVRVDAGIEPAGRLAVHRAAADIEVVATAVVAENANLQLGERVFLGRDELLPIVRLVGIVEATDRSEAYWMNSAQPLDGNWIRISADEPPIFFGSFFASRPVMERLVDGIQHETTLKDDQKVQPAESASLQQFRTWYGRLERQDRDRRRVRLDSGRCPTPRLYPG